MTMVLDIILYLILAYIVFSIMNDAGKMLFLTETDPLKLIEIDRRLNGFLYGLAVCGIIRLLTD